MSVSHQRQGADPAYASVTLQPDYWGRQDHKSLKYCRRSPPFRSKYRRNSYPYQTGECQSHACGYRIIASALTGQRYPKRESRHRDSHWQENDRYQQSLPPERQVPWLVLHQLPRAPICRVIGREFPAVVHRAVKDVAAPAQHW